MKTSARIENFSYNNLHHKLICGNSENKRKHLLMNYVNFPAHYQINIHVILLIWGILIHDFLLRGEYILYHIKYGPASWCKFCSSISSYPINKIISMIFYTYY